MICMSIGCPFRVARHGPVFQSHLLGKPTVVVGDLASWQKALAADFKHLHQLYPESFTRASGARAVNDKEVHASRVSAPALASTSPSQLANTRQAVNQSRSPRY